MPDQIRAMEPPDFSAPLPCYAPPQFAAGDMVHWDIEGRDWNLWDGEMWGTVGYVMRDPVRYKLVIVDYRLLYEVYYGCHHLTDDA